MYTWLASYITVSTLQGTDNYRNKLQPTDHCNTSILKATLNFKDLFTY